MPRKEVGLKLEMTGRKLTAKEHKLIRLLREVKYGQVTIYMEEGQPVRIEKVKDSIKL